MDDNFNIQQLVETKNFDELNAAEKSMVLKDITVDEYVQRRNLLVSARLFLQTGVKKANPNTEYKESIAAIMNARRVKQQGVGVWSVFAFRIPAYIPVAALVLLLFMFPLFYEKNVPLTAIAKVKENIKPEIIYITDTITVEKNIPTFVKVPVIKYVEVVRENKLPVLNGMDVANTFESNNVSAMGAPNGIAFAKEQLEVQLKNMGKSNSESQELTKFLVVSK